MCVGADLICVEPLLLNVITHPSLAFPFPHIFNTYPISIPYSVLSKSIALDSTKLICSLILSRSNNLRITIRT